MDSGTLAGDDRMVSATWQSATVLVPLMPALLIAVSVNNNENGASCSGTTKAPLAPAPILPPKWRWQLLICAQ